MSLLSLPFGFLISLFFQNLFDHYAIWIWIFYAYFATGIIFISMMRVADQKVNTNGRHYDIS